MKRLVCLAICVVVSSAWAALVQPAEIPLPKGAMAGLDLDSMNAIAYSPNGEAIAGTTSRGVEWRQSGTLELVRFLDRYAEEIRFVAFSPDSGVLASSPVMACLLTIRLLQSMEGKGDANGDGWATAHEAYHYAAHLIPVESPTQHAQLGDKRKEMIKPTRLE